MTRDEGDREASPLTVHAESQAQYEALFASIEKPGVLASYRDDAVFAQMRVAGPNPLMIRRLRGPDPRFPVTDAQFKATMGEWDDLATAIADGRVYVEDLTHFEGAVCGSFPHGQKYLAAPLAMFAVPRGDTGYRGLRAVAIQCMPEPCPENPVFTPADGIAWLMAKTALTVADGNMHQAVSHLGRTHLVMAPFIIATRRQLASNHPLRVLLHSHFEGTLGINKMADEVLCKPEGGVDSMLAFSIEGSREAAASAARSWHFNDSMLHAELASRGVDEATALPVYPYRDDALLVWDALEKWVGCYLGLYYGGDDDVRADTELAAWTQELVATDGGRVRGLGEDGDGRIRTLEYLVRAVTHIIFTAGPQHSAVNFPQYEAMSFAVNYPLAMYTPPPTRKTGYVEADYLAMLPTLDVAQYQLNFGYLMGTLRYLPLGAYPRKRKISIHRDERVASLLAAFHDDLAEVEQAIRGRNEIRPRYEYLLPSKITHSLNI